MSPKKAPTLEDAQRSLASLLAEERILRPRIIEARALVVALRREARTEREEPTRILEAALEKGDVEDVGALAVLAYGEDTEVTRNRTRVALHRIRRRKELEAEVRRAGRRVGSGRRKV